jgi:hypothetical protein
MAIECYVVTVGIRVAICDHRRGIDKSGEIVDKFCVFGIESTTGRTSLTRNLTTADCFIQAENNEIVSSYPSE